MLLISGLVLSSLVIGILAQKRYARTGILWLLMGGVVYFGLTALMDNVMRSDVRFVIDPEFRRRWIETGEIVLFLVGTAATIGLFWIILATLPRSRAQ